LASEGYEKKQISKILCFDIYPRNKKLLSSIKYIKNQSCRKEEYLWDSVVGVVDVEDLGLSLLSLLFFYCSAAVKMTVALPART
jgi:hypothetical protein